MSPQFDADLSTISTDFEVLPKGEYLFTIGRPTSFKRDGQKGENFGLRFPLVVDDGDLTGKKISFSAYFHTEGSLSATKRFARAVLGYAKEQDDEFNKYLAEHKDDTLINFDEQEIGQFWLELEGKRVMGNVDIQINPTTDQKNQNFKSWLPYT